MNKRNSLLVGFVFLNIAWQAVVWTRVFFSPIIGWLMICLLPIAAGIVLFRVIDRPGRKTSAWIFVAGGGLITVMYSAASVTRLPEYVELIERPNYLFTGPASELRGSGADFISVGEFSHAKVNKAQFGYTFSLHIGKGGGTQYIDHFVLPVFDTSEKAKLSFWVYENVSTIYVVKDVDEYIEFAKDGTELESFRAQLASDTLFGRRIDNGYARSTLEEFRRKFPTIDVGESPMIALINETPEHYFRVAAVYFWLTPIAVNLIFFGICLLGGVITRKPSENLL